MSNTVRPTNSGNNTSAWNMSQLLRTTSFVGITVSAIFLSSKFEDTSKPKDSTPQKALIKALVDKSEHFGGLPIIRIGNPEEMHTLKSQGKDGLYIFREGNIITYWKIQSGIIESNIYTLTQ